MKIKLLRKVRKEAAFVFDIKLSVFETCNGRVTRIKYAHSYKYALEWIFGERLDYEKDRGKIVCKIARLMWRDHLREEWRTKLKKARV